MGFINSFSGLAKERLFPGNCALCGTMLIGANEAIWGLCDDCGQGFVIGNGERCSFCGRPLISETGTCLVCRETFFTDNGRSEKILPPYEKLLSLFPYTGRYRQLLWSFKYGKSSGAARFFAAKILEALELFSLDDLTLVPVPPRPGKIRRTGWDQIEFLARILLKSGNYPVSRCLVRDAGETQKKLNREDRLKNLKGKIHGVRKAPRISVLFDDVITTGSTMAACAAALKDSGAEKVYGVCLVYD